MTVSRAGQGAAIDRHWRKIRGCTRCLDDPHIGQCLTAERLFYPMPTVGPLPDPSKRVRYLVVAQEPSGSWARNNVDAQSKIEAGFLCFMRSPGDYALQYALEHWLVDTERESYQISDLAKCALRVKAANVTRLRRYRNCESYLGHEVAMFPLRAVIAVGSTAYDSLLAESGTDWPPIFPILHYASRPATWRKMLAGRPGLGESHLRGLQRMIDRRTPANFNARHAPAHYGELLAVYRDQMADIRRALRSSRRDARASGLIFEERQLARLQEQPEA